MKPICNLCGTAYVPRESTAIMREAFCSSLCELDDEAESEPESDRDYWDDWDVDNIEQEWP